ncbi:RIMS-binding protein 3A-like [Suncus etruscus]|uniref:RIMS-binding protein 3A-like n=1 Tax=Suncus etruscus TaxID=109475 RepID=UPI0021107977|nr:RIMS-binding protein 3A-like [Suncus etruscus]
MTKDPPSGGSGGRASSKKPDSPVEEQQRLELEKLRADLERERARGRAERRRFEDQARQLREAAVQERQQLEDHLRSKWEAESGRALRQLQEGMLREREAEIRRLLRWKEAELRQLQRLLHRERDDVVRQARELQRQLAEELVSRGYCGRSGVPEGAARCRCRLQEVLAQLRWDQDGEQASRIRHLQEELDMERQLFLKYILEHFQWQLSLPEAQPGQASSSSEEPPPETVGGSCSPPKTPTLLESLNSLSQSSICLRLRSPALVPKLDANPTAGLHATRSNSLDSWVPMSLFPLEGTPNGAEVPDRSGDPASDASIPDASIPWSPSPSLPPCHPGGEDIPGSLPPFEALQPSPDAQNHQGRTAQQNSELSRLLQTLVQRCWGLYAENQQLRRAGLADEADKKAKRLKVEHAERPPGLPRRRLKDRARKLHDSDLRTLSAPGLGERAARLVPRRASGRQSAQDLSEQASALLAKDKQIEELRRECYLLQARVASGLDSPPLTHGDGAGARGGDAQAQWLSIKDLDRLQRESQREVLRLQKQLALQQRGTSREDGQTTPGKEEEEEEEKEEEARSQIEALERELGACQRQCADLSAQAAAARRRGEEAEAQLQAALHKGAWLARENARLQIQADPRKGEVAAQDTDRRGQLDNACQERDAAALLAQKLMQEATCDQDKQQQLQQQQHDLQKAPCDLQAAGGEMHHQPGNPPGEPQEAFQGKKNGTELQPGLEDTATLGSSRDRQIEKDASQLENPFTLGEPAKVPSMPNRDPDCHPPDSRLQTKKISPLSNSSSEVEPQLTSVPSRPTLDNEDDLGPASLSSTLEMKKSGALHLPKLKIFLVRYSYNPMEGPNQHPESELPLTAGDYIYIWGDMDEDGFYNGELKDGRQGLVPSNLVEPITDDDVLGSLSSEAPDFGLTHLPTEQAKILKEDPGNSAFPGQGPGAEARGPGQLIRANTKTDLASELSGAKKTADDLDLVQEIEEQDFSRPLLRGSGSFCVGPRQLCLQSLAATSAEISWVNSSNSYPHTVYLNNKEHVLIPAGVSRCTLHHLHPGTRYQVRVEVQPLWDSLHGFRETLSSSITFTTPLAGPPDPPLDVLVEPHASPGLLVVSWLPVTINAVGSSNGVQVTGYAVYADGLKVTEVADATAGSIVLELSQLQRPFLCQKVSVRTMSLCGESLDSVPALVPQDGFLCPQTLGSSLFTYTFGDLSACRVAFSVCSQRQTQNAKIRPWTLGNCVEPQTECQEGHLEEPLRRESSRSTLGSERKNSHLESSLQAPEAMQAKKASRENEPLPKSPQNHKLLWPSDSPSEDRGPSGLMGTSTETDAGRKQPSAEGLPRKEPLQCQAALEKIHKLKEAVTLFLSPRHTSLVCDIWDIWQKEAVPLGLWGAGGQEQRKCRRTQTLGCRREPGHMPRSAPFRKVLKRSSGRPPPLLGTGADPTARVLVTLDHNCLMMSGDPKVEREELAIQKGQLLKAWGSQDPHGFYYGQVGNILGHLVTEVEGIPERPAIECHLSATGRLPFVVPLDDYEILPAPQGSLPMPPSNPRRFPLWTPKNMMAALDYDPKDGSTRDQWKGKLSLKAGDMVTVYGPVDDNGFYYGESGCQKGLVPAYLLDHVSVQRE